VHLRGYLPVLTFGQIVQVYTGYLRYYLLR